jgi:hypothetical protein
MRCTLIPICLAQFKLLLKGSSEILSLSLP